MILSFLAETIRRLQSREEHVRNSPYKEPTLFATACVVVGVLAARGTFNSIAGFPFIFAAACIVFGLLSIWRQRPRRAVAGRLLILFLGAAVAIGGSLYQRRIIAEQIADRQLRVADEIRGSTLPAPIGYEPLNREPAAWNEVAALDGEATLITFWARWCSPCWKEMEELEELYREHGDRGLRVLAVTRYDDPDDADERRSDFDKAVDFLDGRDLTFPAAITDSDELYAVCRVNSPPGLVLVDREGRVVDFAIGLDKARRLMERAVGMLDGDASVG